MSARRRSRPGVRADAAIVTEPTELQLAVAHRGFVHLEIETIGRAAHGSRPHLGIDAIAKMGRVLVGIEELDRRLRANPTHPYLGSGSVHASLVEGGQEFSSYPARCVLQAERRTIPGESVELAEEEIREILGGRCGRSGLRRDVRACARGSRSRSRRTRRSSRPCGGTRPPSWAPSRRSSASRSGRTRRSSRAAGIPTVLFGPRGEGAHADVEWVDVASLEQCVEIYVAVAADICA